MTKTSLYANVRVVEGYVYYFFNFSMGYVYSKEYVYSVVYSGKSVNIMSLKIWYVFERKQAA